MSQIGTYHYVSGVDASSSASLAAYLNSLTYSIEDNSTWFSKSGAFKVRNGCYWYVYVDFEVLCGLGLTCPFLIHSCFNAFSRVDVRVDVKIPGGVNAYVIDLRGERCVVVFLALVRLFLCDVDAVSRLTFRHEATPEIWQETYLSALLRSILYADDPNYRLMGYRKLDPITSTEDELKFLQAAEALFPKGLSSLV